MLKSKKAYEFSVNGLNKAINDRKHHLNVRRRILILTGVIALTTVLNIPSGATIAFKCL